MALLPFAGSVMNMQKLNKLTADMKTSELMPMIFVGHGSPTNAMEDNEFTKGWHDSVSAIPRPTAILCISAHWETKGTYVTAMDNPKTIHDFGGFAKKMYSLEYNAPGSKEIANEVKTTASVDLDYEWGLDHGCWVPLMKMFPKADIPVLQLSLDNSQGAQYHYELAKDLAPLRRKGVLIISSGNMVHNLRMARYNKIEDINMEFGFDWALEMNEIFKSKITSGDHQALINYESLSKSASLAIPSTEHYFPLLYILSLQEKNEKITFFNDKAVAGSLTMTSLLVG
jgi:4,5-DOPA dioxygenase extradiol